MLANISIKGKLLIISLITIIVVSLSIAISSIYSINKLSNENIIKYKNESYSKKEEELKNYTSLAMKTIYIFLLLINYFNKFFANSIASFVIFSPLIILAISFILSLLFNNITFELPFCLSTKKC